MNSIQISSENDLFSAVNNCESLDQAIKLIKKIDALKVALESIDQFREKAVLYARLEVEALLKVCELGGTASLRGQHRATAEWLFSLAEEDREHYISMCDSGCTIDWVYKHEVGNEKKLSAQITDLKKRREWLVDDLKENGIVNIGEYCESVRGSIGKLDKGAAEALIDGARNVLRHAGGIGIGDESGIYVMANSGMTQEIESAIKVRVQSIFDDFESLKEIISASHIKMEYQEFCKKIHNANTSCGYVVPCMIAFSQIGLISNSEEMFTSCVSSDISREIDYFKRMYGTTREKYIVGQYEKLMKKNGQPLEGDVPA